MTETRLRPICYPSNEDKDLFDHLRDTRAVIGIANRLSAKYGIAPENIRKRYYIECDKPTPRGKAEALFRVIAYHLDMNVVDVRALVFGYEPNLYWMLLKFAAKLPCANRKAKDSEDIDTTVHCMVSNLLVETFEAQNAAMNAIYTDRVKHHEDEED
jgi:hypothetical protein|nr:MAG TPA: hypothetical protein [Caudoviricetes sp.]